MDALQINANVKTSAIVELYNTLADKPVKKFTDRATAEARLYQLLTEKKLGLVVSDEGAIEARDPKEDTTSSDHTITLTEVVGDKAKAKALREQIAEAKAKREAEKKPAAAKSGARGPAPLYADDGKIKVLAAENPKRAGTASHARFELYSGVKTVADYVAAGGRRADLDWDVQHKFVEVK